MKTSEKKRIARKIYRDVLAIKPNERVLIVTEFSQGPQKVVAILTEIISAKGNVVNVVSQKARIKGQSMDMAVYNALRTKPDVIISLGWIGRDPYGDKRIYKTKERSFENYFYYLIDGGISRGAYGFPNTENEYWRLVDISYTNMHKLARKLKRMLDRADAVIIRDPKTEAECKLGIKDRQTWYDDAAYHRAGRSGNLPAGEVFITPEPSQGGGTLVIRGSYSYTQGTKKIRKPCRLHLQKNTVTNFTGTAANQIADDLKKIEKNINKELKQKKISKSTAKKYHQNIYRICEIGFGLNPHAKISGKNMLVDEKTQGTIHVALGDDFDGHFPAPVHFDQVLGYVDVYLVTGNKKKLILKKGKYLTD